MSDNIIATIIKGAVGIAAVIFAYYIGGLMVAAITGTHWPFIP